MKNIATSKRVLVSVVIVVAWASLALMTGTRRVGANTFTVTNLNDSGAGSLRQAILDANANPGDDTINFSVTGTITLTSGQLTIDDPTGGPLTISGPGANLLRVSGNNASRVFDVTLGDTVTISDLTISNGSAFNDVGAGISNSGTLTITNSAFSGNNVLSGLGGGIYNSGTLTITNSTFSGNTAALGSGGGIDNLGTLTVTNSTFSGNSAHGLGGGISNLGMLTITNSTFSANSATDGSGGGIENAGTLTITNSTFSGNSALFGGGIDTGGTLNLKSSIVANNTAPAGPDIFGTVSSGDFNLVENTSGATLSGTNNITGVDPRLSPLQDNGGPTQTHALLPAAPQ